MLVVHCSQPTTLCKKPHGYKPIMSQFNYAWLTAADSSHEKSGLYAL